MKTQTLVVIIGLITAQVEAQSVLFDFDNAPLHSSLPVDLTAGGISAHLSGTGQGYSVQPANVLGFTPVGFSGSCIYPNSIYAADLLISFSTTLTDFSILYAPEEYACDSSATMRVTAYLDGVLVGTATTNAAAGTWPTKTLRFSSAHGFNSVVIHYAARPVTGGDWGPIFMVDNMAVTAAPPPIDLTGAARVSGGAFQFGFTYAAGATCTVLASANPATPTYRWTVLGTATEISAGQYQFTDLQAASNPRRFYCVRSP